MSGFSLGNVMIYSGVELAVKSESGRKLKILEEFESVGVFLISVGLNVSCWDVLGQWLWQKSVLSPQKETLAQAK